MTSFMNQRKHLDTTMSDDMNNFINRYKFDCSNTNKHKQQLAKTSRGSYNIEEFKKYYTENAKLLKGLEDCISILQLLESIEPWKNLAIIAKLLTQRSSSLLIKRRDNTIDPNTFEVNVGGKVMLFRADRIT